MVGWWVGWPSNRFSPFYEQPRVRQIIGRASTESGETTRRTTTRLSEPERDRKRERVRTGTNVSLPWPTTIHCSMGQCENSRLKCWKEPTEKLGNRNSFRKWCSVKFEEHLSSFCAFSLRLYSRVSLADDEDGWCTHRTRRRTLASVCVRVSVLVRCFVSIFPSTLAKDSSRAALSPYRAVKGNEVRPRRSDTTETFHSLRRLFGIETYAPHQKHFLWKCSSSASQCNPAMFAAKEKEKNRISLSPLVCVTLCTL